MTLRLLATGLLLADLALSWWVVRSEANPVLRWLANRACYRPDGSAYWCGWARVCWFGYWLVWLGIVWAAPWWQVAALVGLVEARACAWNIYCWRLRR